MKNVSEMTQIELAAYVQSWLEKKGIRVILSGGAATEYYSRNRYVSGDIDLVNAHSEKRKKIKEAMQQIGFIETGRHFKNPESQFIVEFPPGPLTVGLEPVKEVVEIEMVTGLLRIISATDCVKDRLAAYYHWQDEQSLYQATLIRDEAQVDLLEIERWSKGEGKENGYQIFLRNKI